MTHITPPKTTVVYPGAVALARNREKKETPLVSATTGIGRGGRDLDGM